ncbi:hypothetical protein [Undibacterium oligocarboniphilum]|uniref:TrbC/VIRB2 family protein n=1 Tax=Undibacterium oligocarboniphilum TaxID=666702 RepID=A0A850QRK9_9BURK|nr:hypothetical protein [Undibacterium oligocarboniphilum]MBC3871410.1 hypothetical protein [Undibacterium oligocarboniphilum]NVO79014.1 hypothetical protein [Undibacterium oligocarboniphilum]
MFDGISVVMCQFIAFLIGPWAWVIGVSAIALGGLALAMEEGKMAKLVGTALLGIGFVVAAPKIMDKFIPGSVGSNCASISR